MPNSVPTAADFCQKALMQDFEPEGHGWRQKGGLVAGLLVLAAAFLAPPLPGLTPEGGRVAWLALSMAVLWVTEALPIPATALMPLVLLPLLGVTQGKDAIRLAAAPYADPIIFLFMGGFMLSLAMERWNLHRRIALRIIAAVGTEPRMLVGGFLLASSFISMWVSNSATAMMLMPIGLSIHAIVKEKHGADAREFGAALVLSIAYGASIGGMGTLIGTPPNAILKGFMEKTHHVEVTFAQWLGFGIPLILVSLPLVYLILTRVSFRVSRMQAAGVGEGLAVELRKLGRMTWPEYAVAGAFAVAVLAWVSREAWKNAAPAITDEVIAMAAAMALFVTPVDWKRGVFVLDWNTLKKFPWDVIVLFGGGLSLAEAIKQTKLTDAMAGAMAGLEGWSPLAVVFLATTVMIAATALTSNTATASAFLPVIGALAIGIDQPVLLLTVPVAVAASADFMLPVGTPPNAVAYGTGLVSLPRMARAGFWINVLFAILIPLMMWLVGRRVFGV